jgi:ATP-dependent helicase HrpB
MPELELPGFDEEDRAIALETICQGALGYKQIKDKEVMPALHSWLSTGQHAALEAYAPTRLKLSNGQNVKLKYELGKPPSIALTVQRLYGIKTSPTIANGTVTIQTHICAPNQRPWQMTQDLENFWKSGFDQMKKDLAGRYPKHNWTGEPR